uniref:Uncharacterized protein n=1 Tax=Naja naja TaxID=35670 RepID=A0A8C6XQ67_NAJNA
MKCIGPSESQNLALVLEYALAREAKIWKVPVFQNFTLKEGKKETFWCCLQKLPLR